MDTADGSPIIVIRLIRLTLASSYLKLCIEVQLGQVNGIELVVGLDLDFGGLLILVGDHPDQFTVSDICPVTVTTHRSVPNRRLCSAWCIEVQRDVPSWVVITAETFSPAIIENSSLCNIPAVSIWNKSNVLHDGDIFCIEVFICYRTCHRRKDKVSRLFERHAAQVNCVGLALRRNLDETIFGLRFTLDLPDQDTVTAQMLYRVVRRSKCDIS